MNNKFTSMFPLPPNIPSEKIGSEILFLNPITETSDVIIDFGITDSSLFILHPNESKKWNDGFMSVYNYINMVDAIDVAGAKCNLNWENEVFSEIQKIHEEFYTPGLPYRTTYNERVVGNNHQEDVVKIGPPSNDYARPCSPVEGLTTAKFPPETRKWIHYLRYIHPLIDSQMRNLMLFEPVSEHMGENVITYNSDVYAVDVHDWVKPTTTDKNLITPYCTFAFPHPHVLREIIRERMIEDEPNEINRAWTKLNSWMHDCMTVEIDLTTEKGTGLWCNGTRDPREPHGVVYVNDIYHPKDYILPIKIPVADALFAYLKDACQLVNHMYQIYNNVKAENRMLKYSPALIKSINQQWTIYKPDAPISGYEPAPLLVEFTLDKWGYFETEVFDYQWNIGVGLEIEETYPRKKLGSGTINADLIGGKVTNTIVNTVDNGHLIPERELVKPPII